MGILEKFFLRLIFTTTIVVFIYLEIIKVSTPRDAFSAVLLLLLIVSGLHWMEKYMDRDDEEV